MSALLARSELSKTSGVLQPSLPQQTDTCSMVSTTLASGGDSRIWPDPSSGRNHYGTRTTPAPDEISFASTTASNVSPEGFAAAEMALGQLCGWKGLTKAPSTWFDEIRARLRGALGIPGAEVVLAASGTDAEIITLCLAAGLSRRPLTNIFIAPDETGAGIPLAASGRHYADQTAMAVAVPRGALMAGFGDGQVEARAVVIRNDDGSAKSASDINIAAAIAIEQELRRGRNVLLHVLDTSKVGVSAVTRDAALALMQAAPGRVRIVVDACQLRCSFSQIKEDLGNGFMVMVTGSKLAGGPAFCGAVLLPPAVANEVSALPALPAGLADYSAVLDWPATLQACLGFKFKSHANIGLGLRWVAGLDAIEAVAAVNIGDQSLIIDHFAREVHARASQAKNLRPFCDEEGRLHQRSIVSLTVHEECGALASLGEAQRLTRAMRCADESPICHLGQPVKVGSRTVVRLAPSARDIVQVAARLYAGLDMRNAFQPISADLDHLFGKWIRISQAGQGP